MSTYFTSQRPLPPFIFVLFFRPVPQQVSDLATHLRRHSTWPARPKAPMRGPSPHVELLRLKLRIPDQRIERTMSCVESLALILNHITGVFVRISFTSSLHIPPI